MDSSRLYPTIMRAGYLDFYPADWLLWMHTGPRLYPYWLPTLYPATHNQPFGYFYIPYPWHLPFDIQYPYHE